jgi:hypothetical protein
LATLDERIARETIKLEQLKRQKRAQEAREKQKERATETRRKIILGGIVIKYFPQFEELQPQKTNEENNKEFESFANFLACLAEKKDLVAQLKKEAREKVLTNSGK